MSLSGEYKPGGEGVERKVLKKPFVVFGAGYLIVMQTSEVPLP